MELTATAAPTAPPPLELTAIDTWPAPVPMVESSSPSTSTPVAAVTREPLVIWASVVSSITLTTTEPPRAKVWAPEPPTATAVMFRSELARTCTSPVVAVTVESSM